MNGKTIIKSIFDELATRGAGVNVDANIASKYSLSQESLTTAEKQRAETDRASLMSTIDDTLTSIAAPLSAEGTNISSASINAAKKIAMLTMCSAESLKENFANFKSTSEAGVATIGSELFADDVVEATDLSREAFDGMQTHNALYFSVAYNLLASRQDEFGEAFFPTIVIDPLQSGLVVENTFAVLMNPNITRTARNDKAKYNKVNIVKIMYDNSVLTLDKNKCIPVYKNDGSLDDLFLKDFKSVNKETGEDIVTAPLKVGEKISMLGISQTESMLAKGEMDNTDALDRSIQLRRVYYTINGKKAGDQDAVETFFFDASAFAYNNFVAAPQGHGKDMILNFSTAALEINVDTIKTANGTASEIFTALNQPGIKIKVEVRLTGSANTEYGDVEIYGNTMNIIEVRNATGDILPSDNEVVTNVKKFLAKLEIVGYTLDAYRTNSNLRTMGHLITIDRYKQEYQIKLRSGMNMMAPINNETGRDNDIDYLNTQIQTTQLRTSADAVLTLTRYAEFLRNSISSGVAKDLETSGIGRFSVHPYYKNISLNLSDYVDSLKSVDRLEDIRSAILNKINDEVVQMDIDSNYGAAHRVANNNIPTVKTIIIGTDPRIKHYLAGKEDRIKLSSEVEAIVVSTYNYDIAGKIFVTYGVFNNERNTVVNPLNFGNLVWAPTIATDVIRTVSNSTRRDLMTMPRYSHIVNLPILLEFNVSDIENVIGKVTINNHVVG